MESIRHHPLPQDINEKTTPLTDLSSHQASPSQLPTRHLSPLSRQTPLSSTASQTPCRLDSRHLPSSSCSIVQQHQVRNRSPYTRPRGLRILNLLRSWLPIVTYAITSLAFLVAIALYRDEVFARLDELSHWLRADEQYGHAVMFFLIFITTFPPIPLYSTLIILSGYTFGPWMGAIISYFAALSGALIVFILSRSLLRTSISRWLSSYTSIKRVVRAIDKRPKLLFLIRLAPYPYNVMNCLLAASPTLTLHTYTVCTALSLFKVIIHTSLGASIHSFKDYHHHASADESDEEEESGADAIARIWAAIGILLCILIFLYLSVIARRAVEDELEDEDGAGDGEETVAFLSPGGQNDCESAGDDIGTQQRMVESPFRSIHQMVPFSASTGHRDVGERWREDLT
ncbi:hypothetical protein AX17_001016 [Amanita inopinata Kibby_2008]|nr:hypothetical protein AX17_001016 [Amanita inopinata Kibby_2008]